MPQNNEDRCVLLGLTLGIFLGIALNLCAAAPETLTLRGEVLGENNTPIAYASCSLTGPGLPTEGRPRSTGERGEFEFTGLIPGSYDLRCAALGYEPLLRRIS